MKTINNILSIAFLLFAFIACNESPTYYTVEDRPDEMHITASAEDLVLSKGLATENAITFKWQPVTSPIENYDSITYTLRLYATDTKNEHFTDYYNLGDKLQKSFTHQELNAIISRWVPAGTPLSVTAQVIGTVNNNIKFIKPESSTIEFKLTGYEKNPQYIYMHMIDNMTGAQRVERMSQRTLGTGIYEATFNISQCNYYFSTVINADYPAYGKSADGKLEYINEGNITKFTNNQSGVRTVIVDTNDDYQDCRIIHTVQLPPPYKLHLCGNGCTVGWDPNSSEGEMVIENPRYPYIYSWTGTFNQGGELKVNTGTGWGDRFFFAPENGADPATDHRLPDLRYQSDGGDLKWVPQTSGKFKFSLYLDIDNMRTTFEPVN